jgi:flagellar hook protein FlgE
MSIWSTLYTGSSGLDAFGDALGVVGDNIANVSTTGFKGSRAQFEDVLGENALNGQRMGSGVRMSGPQTSFAQGSLQQTGRAEDLAIRGNGMFVFAGALDGMEGQYYSRDGRLTRDVGGNLVNSQGLNLQGYPIDPSTGAESPTIGDLQVPSQMDPVATTRITASWNLDGRTPARTDTFDPNDPNTYDHSSAMTVYDSLGGAHEVNIYFRSNGNGAWEYSVQAQGTELASQQAGLEEIASGVLQFNTDGELESDTMNFSSADFLNAQPGQSIEFDFGNAIADGGDGSGSTQNASAFDESSSPIQNGYGAGSARDMTISDDGTVNVKYSNGQTQAVGRVALATFSNVEGLEREGAALYSATAGSGEALIAGASVGGRGSISSGALEGSNVDLGAELVTLIAYQRAFQANARTVTTADEMLSETANLKR